MPVPQREYPQKSRPSPTDRRVVNASSTVPAIVKCKTQPIWSYDSRKDEWKELPYTPKDPVAALSDDPLTVVCGDGAVLVLDGEKWVERTPLPGSPADQG